VPPERASGIPGHPDAPRTAPSAPGQSNHVIRRTKAEVWIGKTSRRQARSPDLGVWHDNIAAESHNVRTTTEKKNRVKGSKRYVPSERHATRAANLRLVASRYEQQSDLAGVSGWRTASYLSQLIGPNPTRGVSEATSRKMEQKLGLPGCSLDGDPRKFEATLSMLDLPGAPVRTFFSVPISALVLDGERIAPTAACVDVEANAARIAAAAELLLAERLTQVGRSRVARVLQLAQEIAGQANSSGG
jgi:hypothetical protein